MLKTIEYKMTGQNTYRIDEPSQKGSRVLIKIAAKKFMFLFLYIYAFFSLTNIRLIKKRGSFTKKESDFYLR